VTSSVGLGRVRHDFDEHALLEALLEADEQVFAELVERWSGAMLRLALTHVHSRAVAEEVVQEAWDRSAEDQRGCSALPSPRSIRRCDRRLPVLSRLGTGS
jgi:anti-sigma factor RsiW